METSEIKCPRCGAANPPANAFCGQCGQPLATTTPCPNCRTPIRPGTTGCTNCGYQWPVPAGPVPKDRSIALILAILFGFWTWLYTYQVDSWKFWINLALSVVTCGCWHVVAWVWAIVDVAARSEDFYTYFPNVP